MKTCRNLLSLQDVLLANIVVIYGCDHKEVRINKSKNTHLSNFCALKSESKRDSKSVKCARGISTTALSRSKAPIGCFTIELRFSRAFWGILQQFLWLLLSFSLLKFLLLSLSTKTYCHNRSTTQIRESFTDKSKNPYQLKHLLNDWMN